MTFRFLFVSSRDALLKMSAPLALGLLSAGQAVKLVTYDDPQAGEKVHLNTSVSTRDNFRTQFGLDVFHITQRQEILGIMNGSSLESNVFVSYESPDKFVSLFDLPRATWIQLQTNGDLLVSISNSTIPADGYGVLGSEWFGDEFLTSSMLLEKYRVSAHTARQRPWSTIGHPQLEAAKSQMLSQKPPGESGKLITYFEPNWVPSSGKRARDRVAKIRFDLANFPAIRNVRLQSQAFIRLAESRGYRVEFRIRDKSVPATISFETEKALKRSDNSESSLMSISRSAAVIAFLPSFSIWESLALGKRPIALRPRQILQNLPDLGLHPNQAAFDVMSRHTSVPLLSDGSQESAELILEEISSDSHTWGVDEGWIATVPDAAAVLIDLTERVLWAKSD